MENLLSFVQELKKPNLLNITVINELNTRMSEKFENLYKSYTVSLNKLYVLQELVKFGVELENVLSSRDDFVSEQLATFGNLFIPVILRIKEICFELNNQIVTDVKLLYDDVIKSQPDYQEKIKIYKSVQIYSYVKVFYNVKPREMEFDEFGISIKVPNYNDKYLCKDIIESFQIFYIPDKVLIRKFDWVWKAENSNIDEKSIYLFILTDKSDKSDKLNEIKVKVIRACGDFVQDDDTLPTNTLSTNTLPTDTLSTNTLPIDILNNDDSLSKKKHI
jgi:hypothetical protein